LLAAGIIWLASRQQQVAKLQAEAETARELAQAQLQHAIESISEGFALFDAEERMIICNTRYMDILFGGQTDFALPGVAFESILRDVANRGLIVDAVDRVDDWLAERLKMFRNPTEAHVNQLTDNRWILVNERKTEDGGTVTVHSDITELKEREFELLKAMEQTEAASRAKGDFLANVSHELRTPLTSILGFTRMIQKRLDDRILPALEIKDAKLERAVRQVTENIKIILIEGTRLTTLINNVLDLAKIESGKMDWNVEPLEPSEAIDQALAATDFLFKEKGLSFSIEIDPALPTVLGDRDKVVQVIVNLISNAIKFTEEGRITCKAERLSEDEVTVSISDEGCGIAEQDLAMVFEPFRQVGNTLTEKPMGTGLGLPICKEIVEHLGGEIWMESTLDKGSKFYFTLPSAL